MTITPALIASALLDARIRRDEVLRDQTGPDGYDEADRMALVLPPLVDLLERVRDALYDLGAAHPDARETTELLALAIDVAVGGQAVSEEVTTTINGGIE